MKKKYTALYNKLQEVKKGFDQLKSDCSGANSSASSNTTLIIISTILILALLIFSILKKPKAVAN